MNRLDQIQSANRNYRGPFQPGDGSPGTVTVVLPTYNRAPLLAMAIEAIMDCAIVPHQFVIVDDGSTDNTPQVISEAALKYPQVECIRNPMNLGVVPSGNIGLKAATMHCVYFAADDDYIDHYCLLTHSDMFARHSEAGISFGDPASNKRENKLRLSKQSAFFTPVELAEFGNRRPLLFGVCAFNTAKLKAIGGFNDAFKWHADWEAAVALAFKHGACYTPAPLTVWQHNPEGFLNSRKREQQREVAAAIHTALRFRQPWPLLRRSGVLWAIPGVLRFWHDLNWRTRVFSLGRSIMSWMP